MKLEQILEVLKLLPWKDIARHLVTMAQEKAKDTTSPIDDSFVQILAEILGVELNTVGKE